MALLTVWASSTANGQVSVTTYHNDVLRTGWNAAETALTVAAVSSGSLKLQHSIPLDDQVDAQPLYVGNQTIVGRSGPQNVVYVATESNTIYAIDADTGAVLLNRNLGPPVPASVLPGACPNNGPNVGINSTPVISTSDNTMWLITYTSEWIEPAAPRRLPVFRLHALDLNTLADKVTPIVVSASATLDDGSTYKFNAAANRQRAGLLYYAGSIYAAFGSFCDAHADISRGWLLRWNANTLAPPASNELADNRANSLNNVYLTSIWMSGYGPAATDMANGPIYFVTGNSDASESTLNRRTHHAESLVRISQDLSRVEDYFTPRDAVKLDAEDMDFGSGGVMVVPDGVGPTPHVAVAAGKTGDMFLVDRDHLGGYIPNRPGGSGIILPGINDVLGIYPIGECFCGPSYFVGADGAGRVVSSGGNAVIVWKLNFNSATPLTRESQSSSLASGQAGGFFTSVSSNGTEPGSAIIWAVSRPWATKIYKNLNVVLYAFDAATSRTLYSETAGTWPNTDGAANIVPTVANGRVYVASNKELTIFGLGSPAAASELAQMETLRAKALADANTWPELPAGEHAIYGTVRDLNGSNMILELRDGKMLSVDMTEAIKLKQLATPVVGRAALVRGRYDDTGTLIAIAVLHASPQPGLWRMDH